MIKKESDWFSPAVVLVALLGIALSVILHRLVYNFEYGRSLENFKHLADNQVASLQREIEINLEALHSIEAFYMGSTHVERHEFRRFVEHALEQHKTIHALEWIPRIPHAERLIYEKAARSDGFDSFKITEQNEKGVMVPAGERDEYFPVYYVEPMDTNQKAMGFDLASNPVRKAALIQARDSGHMTATGPITLVQETEKQRGFLVFIPIYKGSSADKAARRLNLKGFGLAVYRIEDMVEQSLIQTSNGDIDMGIHLHDAPSPAKRELLYPSVAPEDYKKRDEAASHYRLYKTKTLNVADRHWIVEVMPSEAYRREHQQIWSSWIVLIATLLFTAVSAAYLKQRASELRENREQTRAIVRSVINGIITIDTKGTVHTFNPAAEKMFGYNIDEVLGRNITILMTEPNRSSHHSYIQNYLTTGIRKVIGIGREVEGLRKDGVVFPLWLSVSDVIINGDIMFVGCLTDITPQKQASAEIRKLSMAVEQSPNLVMVTGTDGTLEYVNPVFEIVTGYKREEVLGKNPRFLKSGHTPPEEYRRLWQTISAGEVWRGEFQNRRKDGTTYWASTSISPLRNDKDQITHYIMIQEDISVRKAAETALIEAKEAAENANRAKSEFLNMMSHELRTPLTVILGNTPFISMLGNLFLIPGERTISSVKALSKLLATEPLNSRDVREACLGVMGQLSEIGTKMHKQGEHLKTLIHDLLDISKIEAGKMELDRKNLSALNIATGVVSDMQIKATEKQITLTCSGEEGTVCADEVRLKQILINLIGNAVKFTDEGGVDISVCNGDHGMAFTVTDSGCGIRKDQLETIFDTFQQADSSATRRAGGSGLGLAITKRLIELHGGRIHVKSIEGEGSVFVFTIPN